MGVGPPLVSPSGAWSLGESWRPNYHYPKNEPYAPSIKRPDLAQGQIKAWSYPREASVASCQVVMAMAPSGSTSEPGREHIKLRTFGTTGRRLYVAHLGEIAFESCQ